MLLETGGEGVRFLPRAVEGAPEPPSPPQKLILEGSSGSLRCTWPSVAASQCPRGPESRLHRDGQGEAESSVPPPAGGSGAREFRANGVSDNESAGPPTALALFRSSSREPSGQVFSQSEDFSW